MDDMISRQAAIDRATKEHDFFRGAVTVSDKARRDELLNVMCWLGELPPAQLGANLAEVGTDCISRQAALDALDEIEAEVADGFGFEYEKWRKYFCDLPPAQPERIRGRWIEITSSNHTYKCSVCGRLLVNITDGKNKVAKNYPYCHCGADMREVTT